MSEPVPGTLRRFIRQPSVAEWAAFRALREADASYPQAGDSTMRLFAGVVAQQRLEAFQTYYQVTRRRSTHVCLYRLLGAKRCPDHEQKPCDSPYMLPGVDHMSEWVQGGRTVMLVSQPYNWDWETMAATVDLGRQMGFEVTVSARDSWHFPGWTTLVLYRRK